MDTAPDGLMVAMNGGANFSMNRFITGSAVTNACAMSSPVAFADVSVKQGAPDAISSTISI